MRIDDSFFMQLAIDEAWKYQGLTYPNPAVAAVITRGNEIVSIQAHKRAGEAHAEVLAIQDAYYYLSGDKRILKIKSSYDIHNYLYINHNNIFKDCTIYTTLEPCNHVAKTPACSKLLAILDFKRVVIGSYDSSDIAKGGANRLKNVEFVLSKKCDELLLPFVKWSKNNFIFFKWAQNINGVIDGGYISSKRSLEYVHKLRDRCDLLIIGGNTVREDRPTLDARLIDGKAPDILIYSHSKEFDTTIPLFSIKDRDVFISDDIVPYLKKYRFIMIEGASIMLEALKQHIDMYLIFVAPKIKVGESIKNSINLQYLHTQIDDKDLIIWANGIENA